MPRELHTSEIQTEQLPDIGTDAYAADERRSPIERVEKIEDPEYMAAIAFNEEPVTIRIEESPEENAPLHHLVAVNGKGAEVHINGQWMEFGHLPVGMQIVTKRKYLEVLLRSKRTRVTHVQEGIDPNPAAMNVARRSTSVAVSLSIIHDANPRGAAWAGEMVRRQF